MGIIVTDNILRLRKQRPELSTHDAIVQGSQEVGPAVMTAIATTVISFLPVFTMTGAEGKLFTPLAYTKTLVLIAAIILALVVVSHSPAHLVSDRLSRFDAWLARHQGAYRLAYGGLVAVVIVGLAGLWEPLGPSAGSLRNVVFVALLFCCGRWWFQPTFEIL